MRQFTPRASDWSLPFTLPIFRPGFPHGVFMRTRRTGALLLFGLTLSACAGPATRVSPVAAPVPAAEQAEATITANDMYARIAFLADDALRGRNTPSPGLEVAAAYIASEFRRMGLEPAGDNGTYLQRYPFITRVLDTEAAAVELRAGDTRTTLTYAVDTYVSPGRPATAESQVVYAGSIVDPAHGDALRGRVVAISAPDAFDRTFRAQVARARAIATAAGARALLVVLGPSASQGDIARQASAAASTRAIQPEVPVAFVRRDQAVAAFRAAGSDLAALEARSASAPVAVDGLTVTVTAPFRDTDHRPPNVAAVLPGSDPALRDTYIVLSAHFDHVGVGAPDATGDSIYNGADDDASGTAGILEVAEAFASLPVPPRRSLLFLAVSGEEKGLLGSRWFSDNPTVPIEAIVANVNLDMIGRNAPDSIVVIGQEFSSMGPLVQRIATERPDLGLTVAEDIWPEENFFFRSDHFNFARKEIPALFFFAGVHEDYHRPSDHVEKIDTDKAARITRLVYWLTSALANDPQPPQWTGEGLERVRQLTQ